MSESIQSTLISALPAATKVSDTDIVVLENGSTTQKITIAQLEEALGINALNTNCIGSHTAYVAFTLLGDYWWVSSPIPCFCANKRNITFGSNIKNKTDNVNSEISQSLFEIRKYNDSFYVLTNDQSVAGYIFGSLHPNRVWEFLYNVS